MADTLGIHVAPEGITAVRMDAAQGGEATVIALGDIGPAAACLVAHGAASEVVVGDAARQIDGLVVTDPLEEAAAGRIGALGSVINHVVGRAAAAGAGAPRRVAVVVPDDWGAAARGRVVEAGAAAGIADTIVVVRSAAVAQHIDIDPVVAVAAGAARVASLAAAPIVTREDLGTAITSPIVGVPPTSPTSPVSVFGADGSASTPDRPAPVSVASGTEPTTPLSPGGSEPESLRYEPPAHRIPAAAIVAVVVIALSAALGGALVLFDSGDDTVTDELPATTLATATSTTTSLSSTTTEPAPSTSDPDSSSTSRPPTTTTTTTTPTTTRPVPVGRPGDVTLIETGLQLRGGDLVLFGQNAETAIPALTDLLGDPDRDSGYEESDFCDGALSRFVAWGGLELVFTQDDLDSGGGRFTQWFAESHDDPEGLVTFSGVGVGATVGFLRVTFGDALALVPAIPGDPGGLFAATNPGSGAPLNGTTTSREPEGVVISLWAGDSCTRILT